MNHKKTLTRCNPALLRLSQAERVLLLQGPVGAFFDRLTVWLAQNGSQVHRVALQGGDVKDSQMCRPILFNQDISDWPEFFSGLLAELKIDCIVLFGQSRKYHKAAISLARACNVTVVVLEEGYFRPGFVTMELDGVNGFSETLDKYTWNTDSVQITPDICDHHFQKMAFQASLHYQAMWGVRHKFSYYSHHRISQPSFYATYWLRSWWRKLKNTGPCGRFQQQLVANKADCPYYFVPLQHDGDAQIIHHSNFSGNAEFITRVLHSFERKASKNTLLVFRQHPHVRGGPGHQALIATIAKKLGIGHRIFHLVEGDTPSLAEHSAGVILINSTVGLQTLERGAPLMVLGDALYKQPQLTFTGELDQFWQEARPPDPAETASFLAQIKNLTQAPASVYALRNEPICWSAVLSSSLPNHPEAATTHSLSAHTSSSNNNLTPRHSIIAEPEIS